MSEMNRREVLGLLALTPLTTALHWSPEAVSRAKAVAASARQNPADFELKFFTPQEFETVKTLADLIIPKDERSGSATEAAAPEFIDYILSEYPDNQVAVRGGLAWIDNEMRERTGGKAFIAATPAQQTALLDDLAYPAKARPEHSHGVEFFNRFRDMTASAFFSSKMGVADLQYTGNTFVTQWDGCPPAALAKLGVKYE
jgi:gluconate 2-dehydrogenase gamma chain